MDVTNVNMVDNKGTLTMQCGTRYNTTYWFLIYMAKLYQLSSKLDIKVLSLLMMKQDPDGNIRLTSEDRRELVSLLEITNQRLSASLNNLQLLELLTGRGGKYQLSDKLPRMDKDITMTLNFKS